MRAVDTNVLIRLLVRDDTRQVTAAEAFVSRGAWVSHLVLAETVWVLESVYDRGAAAIADTIEMVLNHAQLAVQDAESVRAALAAFRRRPGPGFSDCLVVEIARSQGHHPVGTFDRELARLDGAERL